MIFEQVRAIFAEHFNEDEENITINTLLVNEYNINDYDMDMLTDYLFVDDTDAYELASDLNDALGVYIPRDYFLSYRTVGTIAAVFEHLLANADDDEAESKDGKEDYIPTAKDQLVTRLYAQLKGIFSNYRYIGGGEVNGETRIVHMEEDEDEYDYYTDDFADSILLTPSEVDEIIAILQETFEVGISYEAFYSFDVFFDFVNAYGDAYGYWEE